jgi:hypothetical protein
MKPWAKALGTYGKVGMTDAEKKAMPWLFLSGALVGVVAWLTFALTHSLNTLFEGRKPVVLAINDALFLLSYALFGGIAAIWA